MEKDYSKLLTEKANRFFNEDHDISEEVIKENKSYYDGELESLLPIKQLDFVTFKFVNEGNQTKWMTFNKESFKAIVEFGNKIFKEEKEVVKENKELGSTTIEDFIEENKSEIEAAIKRVWKNADNLDNEDIEQWILNDEGLYNWARSEGVDI
jgi:hypothetical protein